MKVLLSLILVLAIGGLVFSGYLTYRELFASHTEALCAPVGQPGTILGAPPCIYGFFMYFVIAALTTWALVHQRATR